MMKNYFVLLVFLVVGFSNVSAQCTTISTNTPGIYPDTLASACVNEMYADTITIVLGKDTIYIGFTIPFDSLVVYGFGNVPAGITLSCGSNCVGLPNLPSDPAKVCIEVSGTSANMLSNHKIGIAVEKWVTIFGNPVPLTDSMFVYLNIGGIDKTVTNNGTLIANEINASYRWLDCGNNYSFIAGAVGQVYLPSSSGQYAVEITKNGCIDTSACESFVVTGLDKIEPNNKIAVYPNPSRNGVFTIYLGKLTGLVQLEVVDITGKALIRKTITNTTSQELNLGNNKGVFYLRITDEKGAQFNKLLMAE